MRQAEIKALRERLGMDRAAFAAAVGVDPATVWRWEDASIPSKPSRMAERAMYGLAKAKKNGRRQ